jgi:phasin
MTDQFARQAQDMFAAAKDARIPENLQAFAEEGVAKSREAYSKFNATAQDGAKAFEEVVQAAQAGAKAIGETLVNNTAVNTEAAFDAAEAIARAKTLPEAARLQANFLQQQFAIASAQTKELFELSTKVARQTFETLNTASTKTYEQAKKQA